MQQPPPPSGSGPHSRKLHLGPRAPASSRRLLGPACRPRQDLPKPSRGQSSPCVSQRPPAGFQARALWAGQSNSSNRNSPPRGADATQTSLPTSLSHTPSLQPRPRPPLPPEGPGQLFPGLVRDGQCQPGRVLFLLGPQGKSRVCTRWANGWHPHHQTQALQCGLSHGARAQQSRLFHPDLLWTTHCPRPTSAQRRAGRKRPPRARRLLLRLSWS